MCVCVCVRVHVCARVCVCINACITYTCSLSTLLHVLLQCDLFLFIFYIYTTSGGLKNSLLSGSYSGEEYKKSRPATEQLVHYLIHVYIHVHA